MAFVDLCRLCGTDTLNILRNAIFEGKGRAKKYALKISECLTLQVGFQFFFSAENSEFDLYTYFFRPLALGWRSVLNCILKFRHIKPVARIWTGAAAVHLS
jgi:hypothetical protein